MKKGFTLIELMVVISIIGLLSSIILATLAGARKNAQVAAIAEEFHQLLVATQLYQTTTGTFPCSDNSCVTNNLSFNDSLAVLVPNYISTITPSPFSYLVFGFLPNSDQQQIISPNLYYTCGNTSRGKYTFTIFDTSGADTLSNTLPRTIIHQFVLGSWYTGPIDNYWCVTQQ